MKLPKRIFPRKFARLRQEWRDHEGYDQRDAADAPGIGKRTLENRERERATPLGYAIQMLLKLIQPTRGR